MSDRDDRHPDELVSALFDGELAPEEWVEVKEHLERCPRCQRLLESIKALSSAMPAAPPVPADLAEKVGARLPAGTGRQRVAAPREPIPFKPRRFRIGFPLAAGAGLAAVLLLGVMLYEYVPGSLLTRWRVPTPATEMGAEEADGKARRQAEPVARDKGPAPRAPEAENELPATTTGAAADEAAKEGAPEARPIAPPPAPGTVAVQGAEREGLAPGQEMPVVVPEDLGQPARTEEQIEAVARKAEGDRAASEEVPAAGAVGGVGRPETFDAARAAPAAPPPAGTPVPAAASVDACRASWSSQRQAFWPERAGGEPARTVGGAAAAIGGRAILLDGPPRIRITIPRDRWGTLLARLTEVGVAGTAQLPPPPDSADCAVLTVALPPLPPAPPTNP